MKSTLPSAARRMALCVLAACLPACSSPTFHLDDQDLARFLAAGPVTPQFDAHALIASLDTRLQYELGPGDLISIELPVAAVSTLPEDATSIEATVLRRRVNAEGVITLPVAEGVTVIDMTLDEAEAAIAEAFEPYVPNPPSVVVQVEQPQTYPVTVVGTVATPGRHRLSRSQLTLSDALAAAGGISSGNGEFAIGARGVRVYRPGQEVGEEVVLPVRHLNVPTTELFLTGGERIEVVRYEPKTFAVLGLVQNPGVFDFPVESEINLLESISRANGVNPAANPPYATVFREDPSNGEVIASTFDLRKPLEVATINLRPGDIVHVDHTAGTWTRQFLNQALQLRIGGAIDLLQ